ncbi:MAG TPA: glycosyltransferase [Bryobacteraceae bacterium]|nr:glycosyltransferase [Bryobacteraceae bacterium]
MGLGNPHFIHYSPDRGHTAALDRLGILSAAKVRQFVHFAFPVYARCGGQPFDGAIGSRLAFAGNLYVEGSRNLPSRNHPVLAGIEARMAARKRAEITCSCWDLLMDEIQRCEESIRDGLDLDPDRAPFWSFVNDAVQVVGTTESRLTVLTGLRREFDFFGNFMEPAMAGPLFEQYGIRVRRNLDCISELPLLYQNSELIVDVINAGYISGISPKVPSCLASGGLIVFDYKQDFREALGEAADLVMFRNLDEMRSLIDGYLGNPRKRRAVALELQQRVLREFTFDAFCRRVLVEESAWHC